MSNDPERIKWLGDSAEHYFDGLCIGAKLTRSNPGRDEQGWDFFVEMQPNRLPVMKMDAQPAPIKFLCQVKGTDDFSDRKLSMTVSNFDHLARTPLPSFVFVVDYGGTNEPRDTFLCHFSEKRIAETLRRIRELEAGGDTELHKHTMTLMADVSELVRFKDKGQLFTEITKHPGIDLSKYVAKKTEWLKMLGYERDRYGFSFKSRLTIGDLVDASLGNGKIEFDSAVVTSSRFGIELKEEELTSGIICLKPISGGDCRIAVSSRTGKAQVVGQVYAPPVVDLPREHVKLRVSGTILQAYLAPPSCKITFEFDPEIPYELNELIHNIHFICVSAEPDAKIAFQKGRDTFGLTRAVNTGLKLDQFFPSLLDRLRFMRRFLDFAECRESVLLRARDAFEQNETFRWMDLALARKTHRVTMQLEMDKPPQFRRNGIFARPVAVNLNDRHFVAFCYWKARFTIDQLCLTISVRDCRLWSSTFVDRGDTSTLKKEYAEFKEFCIGLGEGVLLHFSPDEAD